MVWYGSHDVFLHLGWISGGFYLAHHTRAFVVLVVLFLLMYWLAKSLGDLDRANANMLTKLTEQRHELGELHKKEQQRILASAYEEERKRLMRDLHDGLSGHLVSIIAQSEPGACDARKIELTARAALDDLRLVLNALDLEDDDLRVALAELRERAEIQMTPLGIRLDWSTITMPEIRGLMPGNSLAILRILQEALTNAIKHGDGNLIQVFAGPANGNMVSISVLNRVADKASSRNGFGMRNMQERAAELGGDLKFEIVNGMAQLTLLIPKEFESTRDRIIFPERR